MKKTLVVGASGATGRHLVNQLIHMGHQVKVIVRSPEKLPETWKTSERISVIQASVSEITVEEMAAYIQDCQGVASCLGHNLNLKGIYGKPRKLVTNAVRLLCQAINLNAPENPVKLVLMNTAGNQNRDLKEPISFWEKLVVGLIRLLLPPHPDNEKASDYLREATSQNQSRVEWVVVRPDTLINKDEVTEYVLHPSPIRSAIFNPGKTSRINVGHFMAILLTDPGKWGHWKGQMPVIYNEIL